MAMQRTVSRARWLALSGIVAVCAAGSLAACGSDEDLPGVSPDAGDDSAPTGDSSSPSTDGSVDITDAGADVACLDASPDADIDCTGKCGPVKDPCTGAVRQCGGCANALTADGGDAGIRVCNLATSSCIAPKVTCTDLGAECGTVKNSCGEYLDCPDTNPKGCASGKECNPDTRKCRDCQPVTCKDTRHRVWLRLARLRRGHPCQLHRLWGLHGRG